MANIWLISDTHFFHKNIIGYCNRPFSSVEEMNETIRDRWNSVIKPQDHVYHLGDVYMEKSGNKQAVETFLRSLNGKKRLVLGNHDDAMDYSLYSNFEKIMVWRNFEKVVLTHVPINVDNIPGGDRINVHGHVHNKPSPEGPYINVSVENTNYYPVNLDTLNVW